MNRGVKFAQGLHTVSRAVGRQLISLSHAKWITMVRPPANQNALCVNSSEHDAVRLVFTCLHSFSLLYFFAYSNLLYYIMNEEISLAHEK